MRQRATWKRPSKCIVRLCVDMFWLAPACFAEVMLVCCVKCVHAFLATMFYPCLYVRLNYKGYHLESRIHFRVHSGLCRVAQMKASST